jgi:hypothetical protein
LLPPHCPCPRSDPFCRLAIAATKPKAGSDAWRSTARRDKALNPSWAGDPAATFEFPVQATSKNAYTNKIFLEVLDWDKFSRNDLLGEVQLEWTQEVVMPGQVARETFSPPEQVDWCLCVDKAVEMELVLQDPDGRVGKKSVSNRVKVLAAPARQKDAGFGTVRVRLELVRMDVQTFREECDSLFDELDTHNAGSLALEDIKAGMDTMASRTGLVHSAKSFFKAGDTNHDERMTKDEFFTKVESDVVAASRQGRETLMASAASALKKERAPPEFKKDLQLKAASLKKNLPNCIDDPDQMALVAQALKWMRAEESTIRLLTHKDDVGHVVSQLEVLIAAMLIATPQLAENVFAVEVAQQALSFVILQFGHACIRKHKMPSTETTSWAEQVAMWTKQMERMKNALSSVKTGVPTTEIHMYTTVMSEGISLLYDVRKDAVVSAGKLGISLLKSVTTGKADRDLANNAIAILKSGAALAQRGHTKPLIETIWLLDNVQCQVIDELKAEFVKGVWAPGSPDGGEADFIQKTKATFCELEAAVLGKTAQFEVIGFWAKVLADLGRFEVTVGGRDDPVTVSMPNELRAFFLEGSDEEFSQFEGLVKLAAFGDDKPGHRLSRARSVAAAASHAIDFNKGLDANLRELTEQAVECLEREAKQHVESLLGTLSRHVKDKMVAALDQGSLSVMREISDVANSDDAERSLDTLLTAASKLVHAVSSSAQACEKLADKATATFATVDAKVEPFLWNFRKFEVLVETLAYTDIQVYTDAINTVIFSQKDELVKKLISGVTEVENTVMAEVKTAKGIIDSKLDAIAKAALDMYEPGRTLVGVVDAVVTIREAWVRVSPLLEKVWQLYHTIEVDLPTILNIVDSILSCSNVASPSAGARVYKHISLPKPC